MDAELRPLTLRDIALATIPATFLFTLDGKEYHCQISSVAAVSPVLRDQISHSVFAFRFTGLRDPHAYFPLFLALLSGAEIDVNFENGFFLNAIAHELQIEALQTCTARIIDVPVIKANAITILRNLGEHGLDTARPAEFLIANWPEFEGNQELLSLPFHSLDKLFDNETFSPTSESAFFDLNCKLIEKQGREFVALLRHIIVSQLEPAQMKKYIAIISIDSIPDVMVRELEDRLTCELVGSEPGPGDDFGEDFPSILSPPNPDARPLVPRSVLPQSHDPPPIQRSVLVQSSEPPPRPAPAPAPVAVPRSASAPANAAKPPAPSRAAPAPAPSKKVSIWNATAEFRYLDNYDREQIIDGVFNQIIREQSRDWNNYVYLTGGGTKDKMLCHVFEFDHDHLFEYHWDNYDSREKIKPANAWLQVQFPFHSFMVTSYTIATSGKQFPFNSQPRSWNLEGSMDGKSWIMLAQVRKEDRFKDQTMALATFPVTKIRKPFCYFRLTQLENFAKQGAANFGEMRINALEFYGTLYKR
jgi:hypothetical protein